MLKLIERWSLVAMHVAHLEDLATDTSLEIKLKKGKSFITIHWKYKFLIFTQRY